MITITAIIMDKVGQETALRDALQIVADHVAKHEPETNGFYISQSIENPQLFITCERFENELAMERHNGSDAVALFFENAMKLIDGEVTLHICRELVGFPSTKSIL